MLFNNEIESFENAKAIYKKLKNADNDKLFICVEDLQGTNWHIGFVGTEKDWLEEALYWAWTDDYETFDFWGDTPQKTIDIIADWWFLRIELLDENNPEHKKLLEEDE